MSTTDKIFAGLEFVVLTVGLFFLAGAVAALLY